jgi:hypothetical protein
VTRPLSPRRCASSRKNAAAAPRPFEIWSRFSEEEDSD